MKIIKKIKECKKIIAGLKESGQTIGSSRGAPESCESSKTGLR